ncbi:hypothetical protein KC851_01780 [Candidatus Kaiserbacteria bacterium]|nr:hypothetical protein [Candidatus Kaiserbacteria bacterium]
MKRITGFLLVACLFLNIPIAKAKTTEDELRLQLSAISDYLNSINSKAVLSEEQLREIINDGVMWTLRAQAADGSFNYEYRPFAGDYINDNGMVRQAGTLFMLTEVHKTRTEKPKEEVEVIENAIRYFAEISLKGNPDDGEFACIKNATKVERCDLGSTALALIGIINFVTAHPDKNADYQELLDLYSSYLLKAKFPNKGFSKRYEYNTGFSDTESPFYNGEAMLALVRFYQYEPQEELKTLLHNTFFYLKDKEYESPLYLWITAALKEMQALWPNDEFLTYTFDFTKERLVYSYRRHHTKNNYCAPLEGLTSAYSILEGGVSTEFLRQLKNEINYWQSKTTALQLKENRPYRLVLDETGPVLLKVANPYLSHGGFLTSEEVLTQRIDFTQHCVSSYLQKLVDIDGVEL